MRFPLPVAWCTVLALAAAGCGPGGDMRPREPVSGKVTLDGQPLDRGEITFVPTAGDGPPAGGKIENGIYTVARADGPVPGPHRVSIFSAKPTGKKIPDDSDPKILYDDQAETIPDRYNARTELTAEVKSGGENTFDFELIGRKDPTKANPKRR
jgi:hypothetical protein